MAKHSKFEFSDFGDSEKRPTKDKYDDFLNDENIDDFMSESDLVIKDETPRYRKVGAGAGLFSDESGESFDDAFDKYITDADELEPKTEDTSSDFETELDIELEDGPVAENFESYAVETASTDGMPAKKVKVRSTKHDIIVASVFVGIVVLIIAGLFITVLTVAGKSTIYDGIILNGKDLGGMTQSEASRYIKKTYIDPINNADITIVIDENEYVYKMSDLVQCPDPDEIAAKAYSLHRNESLIKRFFSILELKESNERLEVSYNIREDINEKLDEIIGDAEEIGIVDAVDPSYVPKENFVTFTSGKRGTTIDREMFQKDLYAVLQDFAKEIEERGKVEDAESLKNVLINVVLKEVNFKLLDKDAIYNETLIPAQEPYFYEITNSDGKITGVAVASQVPGKHLDQAKLADIVKRINAGEDISYAEVPFTTKWASKSKEELESELFRDSLSYATTVNKVNENYELDATEKEARDTNIKILVSKLNGVILMPDDSFSFNGVIEFSKSHGYVAARENTASDVRVVGGGISQVASTIYVAALRCGFTITEHTNNEYLPYYGTLGFDAYINTSSGTTLAFKNSSPYPVKINCSYDGSSISVSVSGTNDGSFKSYSLSSSEVGTSVDGEYLISKYQVSRSSSAFTEDMGVVTYKSINDSSISTETPDVTETPSTEPSPDETNTSPTETESATPSESETSTQDPTENPTETPSLTPSATPTEEPTEPIDPAPTSIPVAA